MEHLTLKAVTTTTDQGLFEAVISTESLDREKDVVSAAGMVAALHKWNRPLPLAWAHLTDAKNIFGSIDTQSARAAGGEVVVDGQIDLESEVGREAWRSFKARTIGFSFGYLILESTKRKGGGRDITELDVFEVTATPTPMNNDTRVLNTKAVEEADPKTLRKRTQELALEIAQSHVPTRKAVETVEVEAPPPAEVEVTVEDPPPAEEQEPESEESLRRRAFDFALEIARSSPPRRKAVEEPPPPVVTIEPGAITVDPPLPTVSETHRDQIRAIVSEELKQVSEVEDEVVEPTPQDPLRKRTYEAALGVSNGGMKVRKRTEPDSEPEPEPLDAAELRRRSFKARLSIASGK